MASTENEIVHYISNNKAIYNFYGSQDKQLELQRMYNNFLDSNVDVEINQDYSFNTFKVKVSKATMASLQTNSEFMDFNFSEDALSGGAYIDVILPNFRNKRYSDAGAKINGKEFLFLIPKGGKDEGQYSLAAGVINFAQKDIPEESWMSIPLNAELEVEQLRFTDQVLIGPNSKSIKANDFSYNINVLSSNLTTGIVEMKSSNVEKSLDRIYQYNKSIALGGHSDIGLVNIAFTENKINSSTMILSDLSNSTNVNFGAGLLKGSALNQHSNDYYISGKELKSILPENAISNAIQDDLIYRPEFDLKKEYFKSIKVYNQTGELNQKLTDDIAKVIKNNKDIQNISRNKFSELVGYTLSNQRQVLTSEQVINYNKELSSMFSDTAEKRKVLTNRLMLSEAIAERREQFEERIKSYKGLLEKEEEALSKIKTEDDFVSNVKGADYNGEYKAHKEKIEKRIRALKEKIHINEVASQLSDDELLNLEDEDFIKANAFDANYGLRYKETDPKGLFGVNIRNKNNLKHTGSFKEAVNIWDNNSISENREFLNKIGLLNNEQKKSAYMTLDKANEMLISNELLKRQVELKNRIVTDFKYNLLKDYGFVDRLTQSGESNISKDMMINRFYEYYNKLENVSNDMLKIKDKLDNTIDEGALLGQIMSGRIFDNYTDVGRQNDVKKSVARSVFATDFSLFGYMEQHNQRAGQSADKFSKAIINDNGESINISKMFGGFYSSIDEMNYKQHQVVYEQEKELIRKLAPRLNMTSEQVDAMPNLLQNQVKVLYANTEGAFLDSNLFTKSFALQNISMQDNKNPFVIKYSSLQGLNAFKKRDGSYYSTDEIEDFFRVISSNQELNDDQKIMQEVMLTNLLGKSNYEKYSEFKKGKFKEDIEAIGSIIQRNTSIKGNESNYILNQEEAVREFNNLTKKYFISANSEARIKLVQNDMLISGSKTSVKGSTYGLIEDIVYTPEGIQLNVKQLLLETEGAKGMLNNSKHTARYTDLIKVVNDGTDFYVEGLMNGLYNKNSRGNFGAFLSMSLTTMVSNALQANMKHGVDITNGTPNYEKRLANFLKSMSNLDLSNSGVKGSGNFKNVNLLDLLNIDIRLENGQVIFTDKNAKEAIRNFDPSSPVGLHSVIIENMNKNIAEKLGRKGTSFTEEEAAAFGYYLMNTLYENYEVNYANTIEESSRKGLTIRMQDASIYNSYIAKDYKTGELNPGMNLLDKTKGVSYLFNMFPSMMYEAKSRADEDALKAGRLSTMILKEAGFGEISDALINKAKFENQQLLDGYLSLVAEQGSMYARGTPVFNNTFNKNVINLAEEISVRYSSSDEVDDYLAKSPLGKLISASGLFDNKRKALKRNASIKGLITGLDSELMKKLQIFFDLKNESKVMYDLGAIAFNSVMYKLTDPNDEFIASIFSNNKVDKKDFKWYKKEITKLIQESSTDGSLDIREAIRAIRNSEDLSVASGLESFLSSSYDTILKRVASSNYAVPEKVDKDALIQIIKGIQKADYSNMNKENISKSLDIFKSFISFAEGYKKAIGGKNSSLFYGLGAFTQRDIINFNLTRDVVKSITEYNSDNVGEFSNIIASFFSEFGLFNRSNLLNISELAEISKFGNVPFLIDSFSIDDNGRNIATVSLQSVERILKSANDLKVLREKKRNMENSIDSDLIRIMARKTKGYKHEFYKDWNVNFEQKKEFDTANNAIYDMIENESNIIKAYRNEMKNASNNEIRQKLDAFTKRINHLKDDWYGATHFNYIYDKNKISDDDLFDTIVDVVKKMQSKEVSSLINNNFNEFKMDFKNQRGIYNMFEMFTFNHRDSMSSNMHHYLDKILKANFNPVDFSALEEILKDDNLDFIDTYTQINDLIKRNRGKGDNYVSILENVRDFFKEQTVFFIRNKFKNYQDIIEETINVFNNIDKVGSVEENGTKLDFIYDTMSAKAYQDIIIGIQKRTDISKEKMDSLILSAERRFMASLVGRTNGLHEELFGENGRLKDLSNVVVKTSAAFSPVYAGGVEQAVINEIESIRNEKNLNILNKRRSDLYNSLKLIYGEENVEDIVENLKNRFDKNNFDENFLTELKDKLSMFTNIVVGDKEMYKRTGQLKGFRGRQYAYQLLSRHPHQYRSSIAPTRYVLLKQQDLEKSFIASIFGSGNKFGNSFQSNLYFIGKRTSLAANGDFDGDTFQILFLGNKDFKYNEYAEEIKDMDAKRLANIYQKKVKLYFLLNNVAGEDLRETMKQDGLKYRTIKKLIKDIAYNGKNFDENGNEITDEMLYKNIELDYLGISHEKIRVMNKVTKETLDHSVVPNFTGKLEIDIEDGRKFKISKKIAAMATIFTDGNIKTKLMDGTLTQQEFLEYIDKFVDLDEKEKKELRKISDPTLLRKVINALGEDKAIIKAQNLLYKDSKYLEMAGIANTGEVHDKLTKYRASIAGLLSEKDIENFIKGVKKSMTLRESTELLDDLFEGRTQKEFVSLFNEFTKAISLTNDIGGLIETLAISSKKGRDMNAGHILDLMVSLTDDIRDKKGKVRLNLEQVIKFVKETEEQVAINNKTGKEKTYKNLGMKLDDFLDIYIKGYRFKDGDNNSLDMTELQKKIRELIILVGGGNLEMVDNKNATIKDIFKDISGYRLAQIFSTLSYSIGIGELEYFSGKRNLSNSNLTNMLKFYNSVRSFFGQVASTIEETKQNASKFVGDLSDNSIALFDSVKIALKRATDFNKKHREEFVEKSNEQINTIRETVIKNTQNVEVIDETVKNIKASKDINESDKVSALLDQISELKKEMEVLRKQSSDAVEAMEQSNKILGTANINEVIKPYQNKIDELEKRIVSLTDEISNYKKAAEVAAETIAENSNEASKAANKISKTKIKKIGPYAIGAIAMAAFFSIFQRSRPVVNLDINEKQYEDSKGSVYRNLGQYTMNTNIRSIY